MYKVVFLALIALIAGVSAVPIYDNLTFTIIPNFGPIDPLFLNANTFEWGPGMGIFNGSVIQVHSDIPTAFIMRNNLNHNIDLLTNTIYLVGAGNPGNEFHQITTKVFAFDAPNNRWLEFNYDWLRGIEYNYTNRGPNEQPAFLYINYEDNGIRGFYNYSHLYVKLSEQIPGELVANGLWTIYVEREGDNAMVEGPINAEEHGIHHIPSSEFTLERELFKSAPFSQDYDHLFAYSRLNLNQVNNNLVQGFISPRGSTLELVNASQVKISYFLRDEIERQNPPGPSTVNQTTPRFVYVPGLNKFKFKLPGGPQRITPPNRNRFFFFN